MNKRAVRTCLPIPPVLLLTLPDNPKLDSPAYFTYPPRIKMLKRGDALLMDEVIFRDRCGRFRTTPRGLPFDGGSYPWIARMLFGWRKYDEETLRTFAMHDSAYALRDYLCAWPLTRKEVDVDLLDGLRCEQPSHAWLKYKACRRLGWIPWGLKSNDPLMKQWLACLWKGDDALDEWIDRVVRTKGI